MSRSPQGQICACLTSKYHTPRWGPLGSTEKEGLAVLLMACRQAQKEGWLAFPSI